MGAAQHLERLIVIARFRQRAAVGAEHAFVVRILQRHALEHGDRLGALAGGAERLGVAQRDVDVRGIGAVLRAIGFGVLPPGGVGAIGRRDGNRAGRGGGLRRLASRERRGDGAESRGSEQARKAGSG